MGKPYTTLIMDPKLSLAQTLRSDLIQFPKRAAAVDRTWKQLLKLYPKVQFKKILSQQQWDDFYSTIPEKVRKQFTEKPFDDPLLWLNGPISQDPAIQKIISQIAPEPIKKDRKPKEEDQDYSSFHPEIDQPTEDLQKRPGIDSEADLATSSSTPFATQPAIPSQPPITLVTQARAPVSKILADLRTRETAPQGIITPIQAKAAAYSGEIVTSKTQPSPIGPIIPSTNSTTYTGPVLANSRSAVPTNQSIKPFVGNFFKDFDLPDARTDERSDDNTLPEQNQAPRSNSSAVGASSYESPPEYNMPMPTSEPDRMPQDEDDEGERGNRPTPPRRQPGRKRAPGRGMLRKISGGLGNVTKIVRLVGFISLWGWVGIAATILILFIIIIVTNPDSSQDLAYDPPTVDISTGDTTVENPEDKVLGVATSSANNKAVLGLVDNLKDLLDDTADRIREFAEKYQKSLVTYTITGTYNGPAYEIKIVYPIPEKARFISASGIFTEQKGTDKTTGLPKTTSVTWLFSQNSGSSPSAKTINTVSDTGISYARYTQSPYSLPQPQGLSDVTYNQTTIDALNRLGGAVAQNSTYLKSKFSSQYVDPFLSVIWVGAIEGIGDQPYFWNCKDVSKDINAGCAGGYYSGGWQVGYGIQVAQVGGHLAADFDSIYGTGKSTNPIEVQRVGQAVISNSGGKIRNPAIFPSDTIPSLVNKADSGNQAAQQAIAILLMDQKLGATAIALEVAADISAGNNWAQTMRGWGAYYGSNMQNFSNRAKAIADKYSGVGNGGGGTAGTIFGSKSFTVTLLPIVKDDVLESGSATITVDEVPGSTTNTQTSSESGSTSNTINSGHVPPSTNTCNTYSLSSNPAGKNYGDPTCNYDKNKLFDLLKKLDPANANLWFNKIIPCESAYNPNEFYRSGAAGDTPDPYGAWGLYQMGRGADGPFINLTRGSTNNPTRPEDRGDVNWELQTSNAVNFNKKYLVPNGLPLGAYWQCAR